MALVKRKITIPASILLLVMLVALLILAFPYLASAYHLEVGSRALEKGGPASAHLQQALVWDPQNAQAYRLLAIVLQEQGNLPAAIDALERYTQLRPQNPLGHMQLAQDYEEARDLLSQGESLNPRILAEWSRAGFSVQDLLHAGETIREAGSYDQAMEWYQRALLMEPELGDPWYYIGLAYANQKMWDEALAAYDHAFVSGQLQQVGRSDLYYQKGTIYQRDMEPPQMDNAFSAYMSAVSANDFTSRLNAAWAHARLGQVYYTLRKDLASAEREVLLALEMAPDQKWLYVVAGDLYRQSGQNPKARNMYEQALFVSPGFEAAQERLDAVH